VQECGGNVLLAGPASAVICAALGLSVLAHACTGTVWACARIGESTLHMEHMESFVQAQHSLLHHSAPPAARSIPPPCASSGTTWPWP